MADRKLFSASYAVPIGFFSGKFPCKQGKIEISVLSIADPVIAPRPFLSHITVGAVLLQ